MSEQEGVTVLKSNFSEWYQQVIRKAGFADYSAVSGCMVIEPYGYAVWELIQRELDARFKSRGVRNAYYPMLIPKHLFEKEREHVEGFNPEVAWVTKAGDTPLDEQLAIRPTSETIMYEHFSKKIRSWRDLPYKVNQWVNIVRWEFKHPKLFLRTREFLWQEGHTAFATKEEAEDDMKQALDDYKYVYEHLLAVPVTAGEKTQSDKFAGADYSWTLDIVMPDGKMIQGATVHHLGQRFSRMFDIQFLDKSGNKKYVYQNSWGFATRAIGALIAIHGDDKGAILPPRVAPIQVVVVPIFTSENKPEVMKYMLLVESKLKAFRYEVDLRDRRPGWKFNYWELKGVPVRLEVGPKDADSDKVTVVRRDTGEKSRVPLTDLESYIDSLLVEIHDNLYNRARKLQDRLTVKISSIDEVENKNVRYFTAWCGSAECEDKMREKGFSPACVPFDASPPSDTCFVCGKPAKYAMYWGRFY